MHLIFGLDIVADTKLWQVNEDLAQRTGDPRYVRLAANE